MKNSFYISLTCFLIYITFSVTAQILTPTIPVKYNLVHIKETRIKVAVIDTGINLNEEMEQYLCVGAHYDLTNTNIKDSIGHGTNIAGIIAKNINPKTTCLLIIKYYASKYNSDEINALKIAKDENVKYINFSSGGAWKSLEERHLIQEFIDNKVYFVTSAGNETINLDRDCYYYPACYNFFSPYFRVAGSGKSPKKRDYFSNYGMIVTDWRNGLNQIGFNIKLSGTSQAAAVLTSELAGKE